MTEVPSHERRTQQYRRAWGDAVWQFVRPYGRYIYYALRPAQRPDYFQAPWRCPTSKLTDNALEVLQFGLLDPERVVFLFLPMVDWHVRFQRSQQLARALAGMGHACIYVNPQLGCEYRAPYLLDPQPRLGMLSDGVLELHVHLPRAHQAHQRALTRSEIRRVVGAVERVLEIGQFRKVVQIVSFPRWLEVAQSLRERRGFPVIYDCHDYLRGFDRISAEILDREDALLERADSVVFSAEHLRAIMTGSRPFLLDKSSLVRNAANPADFESAVARQPHPGGPIVGYAGALESWFDVDLLWQVARARPDIRFQLLGRVENRRVLRLKDCPNVEFVAEVPYSEIPGYLKTWNAAIIPFSQSPLTEAADMIKLYEYFSAGLPVVSTPLRQVEQFRELVYIGEDARAFSACLDQALAERSPEKRELRVGIARQETWAHRARSLVAISRAWYPAPDAAPASAR